MVQIEYRAVIKFLTKQGKTPQIILNKMGVVYGDQRPDKTMIYKWHGLFKHGRESIEEDLRPGRPVEATTSNIVKKVEKLIIEGTHLKKKQLSLVDYKEKGVTITGEYYSELVEQLKEAIKEKRRGKWTKSVLLLQDNAPVHKSKVAMAALHRSGFELLVHPPYSPDLTLSDYYLFPNFKKELRGKNLKAMKK
ncbi:Protein GVQW3, partial [Anthophora plagiata]